MATIIEATARMGAVPTLTAAAFRELSAECGGHEAAVRFLVETATRMNRPIAVNLPAEHGDGDDLCTILIGPSHWSDTRLKGWLAGLHGEFATLFGEINEVHGPEEVMGMHPRAPATRQRKHNGRRGKRRQ
jgi:hypothetical protein